MLGGRPSDDPRLLLLFDKVTLPLLSDEGDEAGCSGGNGRWDGLGLLFNGTAAVDVDETVVDGDVMDMEKLGALNSSFFD